MPIKLTVDSFLAGVRQSGLIDDVRLDEALRPLRESGELAEAESIAAVLVERRLLTRWQADKLLQGKFKGFVLGRYRLLELLGRGEMSTVYLAEHVRMKRRCAIKVLPASKARDTSYLGRFLREAEAVAALDHPNIVRAYDVDMEVEAGTEIHFLAMEYVEGKDLEKLLAEREQFPLVEAADIIRQAAEGLAHAHENGLIHRDIKPGNLLVDGKGTVKLLDLGLARFFRADEVESLTIKHDEKVLGTADYLAPEQAVDSHAVDERADVYSLGCTFYFTLAGQPPFTEGTLVQRLLAHQTKLPPPVSRLRPDVPPALEAILQKMLQKRREDRYQSAREVADALARWLVHSGDADWRRTHPAVVAAVMGVEGLLLPDRPAAADRPPYTLPEPNQLPAGRSAAPSKSESNSTVPAASQLQNRAARRAARRDSTLLQPAAGGARNTVVEHGAGVPSASHPGVGGSAPGSAPSRGLVAAGSGPRTGGSQPTPAQRWKSLRTAGRKLLSREGWLVGVVVLVGLALIGGVGVSLHAMMQPPPPPVPTPDEPLDRLPLVLREEAPPQP